MKHCDKTVVRFAGTSLAYTANALNQYTQVLSPEETQLSYDFDGNATLIKTATGTWSISCNGKNRPVRFENTGTPSGSAVPANPLQWSSEICDSELDLVYYNYRHYSPALGRFLSRDPIEEIGGLNLYCFCGNNLLNLYDLLGYVGIKIEPYQNTNIVKVSPYSSKLNGREAYIQVTLTPFQVGIKLKKRKIFGDDIFALDVRGGGFSSVTYHSEDILFEHPNNIFRKKSKLYMHEEQHYLDRKKIYEEYQKIILSYNEVEICGDYCQDQYISVNDIAIRLMKAKIGLADNLYHSIPGNYYDSENDQKEISQNIKFFSNEVKVLEKQLINAQKALEKCIKEHQK